MKSKVKFESKSDIKKKIFESNIPLYLQFNLFDVLTVKDLIFFRMYLLVI